MKTYDYFKYGHSHPIELRVAKYSNGNLAIRLVTHEAGYAEPWSNLTVNLLDNMDSDCAFVDTNNNGEGILSWIEQNCLGATTGRMQSSGYCEYPEYQFDLQKIAEEATQ
jgi:hypothetical protein